jgi:hypothetical protein
MSKESHLELNWIKLGIIAGFLTSIIYPLLIFVDLPKLITVFLAAFVGPLLSVASYGLYQFMKLHRKTVTLQIAMVSNIIAGAIFNLMLIVQLATRVGMRNYLDRVNNSATTEMLRWISKGVLTVQAGLDVSWDIYIVIGTFFFGLNMLVHPRFGRIFAGIGILMALLLLVFNLYTFPTPPMEAELIDFGPFVGLWYLAVTVQIFRSTKWVKKSLDAH